MIKISIIIPVFNKENYIQTAIESVLSQSFKDFEIIIVNDGSTDNTLEVLSSLTDKRIRIINQSKSGVSLARNRGIIEANGEYICFLDADDLFFGEKLSENFYLATKKNLDFIFSDYLVLNEKLSKNGVLYLSNINKELEKIAEYSENKSFIISKNNFIRHFFSNTLMHTNAVFIRKNFLLKNDIFFNSDLVIGEDQDFWWRIITHKNIFKIGYIDKPFAIYRFCYASWKNEKNEKFNYLWMINKFNLLEKYSSIIGRKKLAKYIYETSWIFKKKYYRFRFILKSLKLYSFEFSFYKTLVGLIIKK